MTTVGAALTGAVVLGELRGGRGGAGRIGDSGIGSPSGTTSFTDTNFSSLKPASKKTPTVSVPMRDMDPGSFMSGCEGWVASTLCPTASEAVAAAVVAFGEEKVVAELVGEVEGENGAFLFC